MTNWIEDRNPFHLPKPPEWWLRYMYHFDPDLVMIPSRKRAVYNLCRPARRSPGIGPLALTADPEGDLTLMKNLGLVPSAVIVPSATGAWTTNVFDVDLASRDIWRHGGADTFSDKLEAAEREREEKQDAQIRDECYARRRDMARSFKARTGQRTKIAPRKPKKREVVMSQSRDRVSTSLDRSRILLT